MQRIVPEPVKGFLFSLRQNFNLTHSLGGSAPNASKGANVKFAVGDTNNFWTSRKKHVIQNYNSLIINVLKINGLQHFKMAKVQLNLRHSLSLADTTT
jgi:hypothetical protein